MDLTVFTDRAVEIGLWFAPKLISAILVLVIGWLAIGLFVRWLKKNLQKKKVDKTLAPFLTSFIGVALKILLIITVISMVGVQMTSFIAVLAAAGLAVGFALQGSLANFAGGVLILVFKPFKVGHFIEAGSHMGTVHEIRVLYTVLKTPDNKTVVIPNGQLANSSLTNFSIEKTRRVDMEFGIGYEDDIKQAKKVLESIIKKDKRVLKDPAYQIVVANLGDSSVDFKVRAWVQASDYWTFFFDMQETVKQTFDKEGISIPYPQRDVHVYNKK